MTAQDIKQMAEREELDACLPGRQAAIRRNLEGLGYGE